MAEGDQDSGFAGRRAVVALLVPVRWHPPGIDPDQWRAALAEDLVDLLATLSQVEPVIAATAADQALAAAVAWPTMPVYEVPAATPAAGFAAAARHGYTHAAVLAADAPDLPALLVGKLLRPLTTRPVAAAPALTGPDPGSPPGGLLGVAARLPAPDWLPELDLDAGSLAALRAAAPARGQVAAAPGWRRLRGPADLSALDPAVPGWDLTRAILSGAAGGS